MDEPGRRGGEHPPLPPENVYGHTKKLRFILRAVDEYRRRAARPITLLDFGCGNGAAVSQYLIGEGTEYYGLDVHEPSLAFARARWSGPHARFLERVPPDVRFDVVVYADVLEHLADPLQVLREHRCQLVDDGLVVGAIPNGFGPFEVESRITRALRLPAALAAAARLRRSLLGSPAAETGSRLGGDSGLPYNADSPHVQFFRRGTLLALLRRAHLCVERFENGSFLGAPVSEKLLLRGERVARLNARVADVLPYWAVSSWLFTARACSRGSLGSRSDG